MPETRSQAVAVYFADKPGFAVDYLYGAFRAGIHTQSAAGTFFLINFHNVTQDHLRVPHQILSDFSDIVFRRLGDLVLNRCSIVSKGCFVVILFTGSLQT